MTKTSVLQILYDMLDSKRLTPAERSALLYALQFIECVQPFGYARRSGEAFGFIDEFENACIEFVRSLEQRGLLTIDALGNYASFELVAFDPRQFAQMQLDGNIKNCDSDGEEVD